MQPRPRIAARLIIQAAARRGPDHKDRRRLTFHGTERGRTSDCFFGRLDLLRQCLTFGRPHVEHIWIVDDEPDLCDLIADTLGEEGYQVTCAHDGAAAIAAATEATFDVVLADMRLPKMDGLTLFRRLRAESPTTDMILMTGNANVADVVAVLKEGAFDYLTKPIQLDELGIQLKRIASYRGLQGEVAAARAELASATPIGERLVGRSPEMQIVVQRIEAIAHSDASVVITGESGTGKELVAHALHDGGAARGKPFVAVNCAAFPDTLIESELFGHERGAFTGATDRRDGRFKAADGGTLFLDESGGAVAGRADQAAARTAGRDD